MSTNAPTLVSNVYPAFNAFKLAFEPTASVYRTDNRKFKYLILLQTGDNRYRCVSYVDSRWQYNYIHGRTIHMRDHGTRVPLPSRALLQFHAAIARVLHLTGAGELIDRVQRDRDEIRVLAQDGSTDVVRMVQMLTGH